MRTSLLTTLLACLLLPSVLPAQEPVRSRSLAFTHVTVVDLRHGRLLADRTVLIAGDRVAEVGPSSEVTVPESARVVDASGRYLIPGLWDMHTHLLWSTDASEHVWTDMPEDVESWTLWERYYGPTLNVLIANGITGIREMWGNLDVARRVRREVTAGERIAPRIVVAGHVIDGPPALWPGLVVVATPEEAREAVDSLEATGAAFIKVRYRVRPEEYRVLVRRSTELDIPLVGHVPHLVRASTASDQGQRSIEHWTGVVEGCSSAENELIALNRAFLDALSAGNGAAADSLEHEYFIRILGTQDGARCRALLRQLARNATWQTPTLIEARGRPPSFDPETATDPRMKYLHPGWRTAWLPENSPYGLKTDEGYRHRLRLYERKVEITGMAAEEGVPILAGTDTPNAYVFPGFGLHDELALLVEAGLTPLQALQAATLNPARFFGATDSLGTVEAGKLADLVLLDADPLADITNTREIRAVVLDGRYLDREALDGILAEAEHAARDTGVPEVPPVLVELAEAWEQAVDVSDFERCVDLYAEDVVRYRGHWMGVHRKDDEGRWRIWLELFTQAP